jgi:hypothetical protein
MLGSGRGIIYLFFALRVNISLHFSTVCTEGGRRERVKENSTRVGHGWREALSPCVFCRVGRQGSFVFRWVQIAPSHTEQLKLSPLLWLCLFEPRQPSEALRLPCSANCIFLPRKQWRQRRNSQREKCIQHLWAIAAEFLSWRILELFTFLTLLRLAQVHSGEASILFFFTCGAERPH